MKIRELMTTDVTTAELDTTLDEIATIMRQEDVGAVPVVDDDELVGIVTDRDIVIRCIAEGRDPSKACAEDVLTEGLVTAEPEDDVEHAADLMSRNQIRRLPVVRDGQLVGMISIGDIAVKQRDDEMSGDALEDISQGVKQQHGTKARAQQRTQRTGEDQQGIANRGAKEEKKRQERVVPIRSSKKASGPGRNPRKKIS